MDSAISSTVSVLSKTSRWRTCTVLDTRQDAIKIHYDGFHSQFDEWITDSARLRAHCDGGGAALFAAAVESSGRQPADLPEPEQEAFDWTLNRLDGVRWQITATTHCTAQELKLAAERLHGISHYQLKIFSAGEEDALADATRLDPATHDSLFLLIEPSHWEEDPANAPSL